MKKNLITAILQCMAANGLYISGELFFTLAFRTEAELKQICRELHINPETV
jgi:hypothetical protein